ncbi:MAG TPA: serine hydrolase domain-containing protein [Longimicrobium sp.]|jgi:CubicO group peptidase (beta-lactamase class C family)|uniref:serine hydrolase domain-containing protein n=1 Tax=Longimicrobium sp. TaxID=2029185 RepID=UPI002ED95937
MIRRILLTSLLFAAPLAAQPPATSSLAEPAQFENPDRLAQLSTAFPEIDRMMREFAERSRVPGIAYGIVVDGRLAHVGTAGIRELRSRAPVDTGSVFRIASMTKSFTAVAILQLRDEGKLSLDDPAERYVPELAALHPATLDAPKVTIRHLLTHSAGFPEDNPWGDQQLAATDAEMSAMMRDGIPFSTAPGTAYEYSNFGFAILGRIVANVSGMPYPRYITERVLRPLGMNSTTLEARAVPAGRLAHGYRLRDSAWIEEPALPDGAFGPMGGMLTSVSDLSRWVAFMLDAWPPRSDPARGPLSRASLREMQQVARFSGAVVVRDTAAGTVSLSAGGYGYGLGVRQTCLYRMVVSHSGGLPGYGSLMRWLPEYGVGIVAMGNLTYTGWSGVTDRAIAALARTGGLQPRVPDAAPVLIMRQQQVIRLLTNWDDPVARGFEAMNLFLDEPEERRRAFIQRLVAEAGGGCRQEGDFLAENALRGSWRMRCRDGDLRFAITLAPTEPARVQYLDVARMGRDERLEAPPACR